jgi:hypothetical protein
VATGLAVVAVLASGCSEPQQASETLPSAVETLESPALEPLGPPDLPVPDEARVQSPEGFNAFTEYYIALINRLQQELEPTYLRQFSRNCETCDRLASDAERDAGAGYTYQGGGMTISAIAPAHLSGAGAETAFTINQAAYAVLDASGNPVAGLSGESLSGLPAGMSGIWVDDHWLVTNLSFG